MQLSTVCRSLREAVSLTVQEHSTLALPSWEDQFPDRLDSKLLLGWASSGSWGLKVAGSSYCNIPGLTSFLQAAAPLRHRVELQQPAGSSMRRHCAQSCHWPSEPVEHWAAHSNLPAECSLPSRLHVSAQDRQVDALLYRLSFLPCLDWLDLQLGPCSVLTSPRQFPPNRYVILSFTVLDGVPIDFSWLHAHPFQDLVLQITLQAQESDQQVRLIDHLLPLRIKRLTMDLQVPLLAEAQQRWLQLAVLGDLDIDLPAQGMHLSHLPRCQECCISGHARSVQALLTVDYAALSRYAGRYRLNGYQHQSIMVLGCPGHVPQCAEPWQISSSTPHKVGGLPGINGWPPDSDYKLQNVAADDSGW